jgi:hypothetical protein
MFDYSAEFLGGLRDAVNKEPSESQYRKNAEVVSSMLREDFQEFGTCGRSPKSQSGTFVPWCAD